MTDKERAVIEALGDRHDMDKAPCHLDNSEAFAYLSGWNAAISAVLEALDADKPCWTCGGSGEVPSGDKYWPVKTCPVCEGK